MQNQELEDILTSLQQIVRQAYALGRSEALKQVVEVLKADAVSARPLALLGHATDEAAASATPPPAATVTPPRDRAPPMKPSNDDHDASPWWERKPRKMW